MTHPTNGLELRPDRATVVRWSVASGAALATFVWVLLDSGGHLLAWLALTFAAVVAGYFVAQLVAPSRFRVRLDDDGLRAWFLWSTTDVSWDVVHVAHVGSLAGEPVLELELRGQDGDGGVTRRTVLLPVGCDLRALHRFLARRLGRGGLRPPRTFTPIELDQDPR